MSLLNRYLDDAYIAWLGSSVSCCAPQLDERPRIEKPMTILHHQQPRLIPPPIPEPQYQRTRAKSVSSRVSFSVRRKLNAYNGPRRPHISAPTDFRHVEMALPRRTERFRPLELSIYMPENHLSPIQLPHFEPAEDILSYPPAALVHTRSESALSNFSIRRKPLSLAGPSMERRSTDWVQPLRPRPSQSSEELMAAIQIPAMARLRANIEPYRRTSEQIDRVKSAFHERDELERKLKDIDSIIEERKSFYLSRPGSAYQSEEPLPDLLTSEIENNQRPKTAPSRPTVHIPLRAKSFTEASAAFNVKTAPPIRPHVLSPPLPLVLQAPPHPPLRKKKSFSRVSNWLFPSATGGDHSRHISLDSVTNMPRPVTMRDGFYQCVDPKAGTRISTISVSTVETLETMESDGEERTVPTSWTPESSPRGEKVELVRTTTFGNRESVSALSLDGCKDDLEIRQQIGCRVSKVGVAF